ncbi:type 1 glutamine amidotransferase [Acidiphilium acidophilum]|uniref:Glutamine amidotransferase domain-containing protein n=1 Tax=Acidiphilium acidophilum TaxID=76588 RepID=A0AAW9DVR9_ACIAO|nr:hypothetical protein [Acidiphilium acidophilum]MDX5932599.1 hypothetical protein [Acidiphilium acidophilum]
MITLGVLQHTDSEYLGLMEDHFEGRNIRFHYIRPFTPGATIPATAEGFAGLIVLGAGPRGAVSGDLLASLGPELRLIRDAIARQLPIVGLGLGAAMLAIATGGGAEDTRLRLEVVRARRSDPAALGGMMPVEFPIVIYGRDRAILPPGAEILATTTGNEPAVFRINNNCLGFIGHPGIKRAMIEDLVMEFDEAPEDITPGLVRLGEEQRAIADALTPIMVGLIKVTGWMG